MKYSQTSLQWPPQEQKEVVVVGGGGGITGREGCYITIFLMEFNMFIVSKFMLTVSHNDNPIIDFVYRLTEYAKKLE